MVCMEVIRWINAPLEYNYSHKWLVITLHIYFYINISACERRALRKIWSKQRTTTVKSWSRWGWFVSFPCILTILTEQGQEHHKCLLEICKPYGEVRSCTTSYLLQLSTLITTCQTYLPTFRDQVVHSVAQSKDIKNILDHHFPVLSTPFDDHFYESYMSTMKRLSGLAHQLTALPLLQQNVTLCMKAHNILPTDSGITARFHNLCWLQHNVIQQQSLTEATFYEILDSVPDKTEAKLNALMREVRAIALR